MSSERVWPFDVLGVDADASLDDIRRARRSRAQQVHPDHGGDTQQMAELNRAFDAAVAHVTGRRPLPDTQEPTPPSTPPRRDRRRLRTQRDVASFTIDALPVEAFEALLVVTACIGDVLVDEPPYVLETVLHEPAPCWCRLDLVPDAGASTVSLTVATVEGHQPVDVDEVRDEWVRQLNSLGDDWPSDQ
jgi:hypothetical protein